MVAFRVGQTVKHPDGKQGIIRYLGPLDGKAGVFIGVELDDALGKNDGSVDGKHYFRTKANHGIFYRDTSPLQIIAEPKPSDGGDANGKPVAPSTRARPSSINTAAARTRQSIGAGPAKRMSTSAPSPSVAITQSPSKRHSMASPSLSTPAGRPARQSLAPRSLSPQKPSARLSTVGTRTTISPPLGGSQRPGIDNAIRTPLRPIGVAAAKSPPSSAQPAKSSPRAPISASRNADDEAKLKQLERARAENKDMAKELEQIKELTHRYETINEKLQNKCKTQHEEILRLSRELKEKETQCEQLEKITSEHDSIMEMAALDREMAEEKEDAARAELEAVKEMYEELKLEYEILKEDNEELSKDMSPEERASQGWLQMEREKERLKQALIRLRELTQEREAELTSQVESLERDNEELLVFKEQFEETKAKLLESEAQVEDLREQLEVAENAEVMIEQLTERNTQLSERVETLRNEVEDLQNLKEVSDETEQQYNEYIKQLEEIINTKESVIGESTRRAAALREDIEDKDYTIARFRDLVMNMQSDLEDMRASKEITETEALELGNHTRTMMDLNRQLQASATSTKLKTIDSELRRMEAEEASEHLGIVQLFLPEAFQAERDSVLALLRFRRVGFKSRLLHSFVKERVTSPSPHSRAENILAGCDALDKLTWITAVCERFSNSICSSSTEQFSKFESTLYELEPVERTLNGYIEALKKDELQERVMVDGLQRSIAVLSHLSDLYLRESLESYAEEILMKTQLMQSNMENTAATLLTTKNEILRAIPPSAVDEDELALFTQQADTFASQSRSAKVIAGKILKSLQDFKARSLVLNLETRPLFEACSETTEGLAIGLRTLGYAIFDRIYEDGQLVEVDFADTLSVIRSFNNATFNTSNGDVWSPLLTQLRRLHERLSELYGASTDLGMTVEFEKPEPPWVLRSKELAARKIISIDAEEQIATLKREVHDRTMAIKLRDLSLADANLKAETLEARMRDSSKKANRISELEASLAQHRTDAAKMRAEFEALVQRNAQLADERDKWLREAHTLRAVESEAGESGGRRRAELVGTSAEMESLKREIEVLESTTRYLRQQVRRTRAEEAARANSWLNTPLLPRAAETAERDQARAATLARLEKLTRLPALARPILVTPPSAPATDGSDAQQQQRRARRHPPQNRLAWRPMATTPQWQLSEMELAWLRTWGAPAAKSKSKNIFWVDAVEQLRAWGDAGQVIAVG